MQTLNDILENDYETLERAAKALLQHIERAQANPVDMPSYFEFDKRVQALRATLNKRDERLNKPIQFSADLRQHPGKEMLQAMTTTQLNQLRDAWYEKAKLQGLFAHAQIIAKVLMKQGYGGDTCVYQDDKFYIRTESYSGLIAVDHTNIPVMREGEYGLFIPGPWVDDFQELTQLAHEKRQSVELERQESERTKLISLLSGIHDIPF